MPCKDSSSRMVVEIDGDERLVRYDYDKITCGKRIGGGSGLESLCAGWPVERLLAADLAAVETELGVEDEDDRFLLQLEWSALQAALSGYRGLHTGGDERHRIASIDYSPDKVVIGLVILPPPEMPKIRSCRSGVSR